MKSLEDTCSELREQISGTFDLGPGDAKDLFKLIWDNMTADPASDAMATAIVRVEEHFDF